MNVFCCSRDWLFNLRVNAIFCSVSNAMNNWAQFAVVSYLINNMPNMKIVEFANSENTDEVAHNEPPNLGPHCFIL